MGGSSKPNHRPTYFLVTQIENEIVRLNAIIDRADDKIEALETRVAALEA